MALIISVLMCVWSYSQITQEDLWGKPPSGNPETLYFPFEDGVQLIVINYYDTWSRKVDFYEQTQPRGLSWGQVFGPSLPNAYIFRDSTGSIIKSYNTEFDFSGTLEDTNYINTNQLSLFSIEDYNQFNGHLKYYEAPYQTQIDPIFPRQKTDTKVGIINRKGDVVVKAVYDNIRVFQDRADEFSKYVISKDGNFGFLDSNFNVIFDAKYKTYHSSQNKLYNTPEHNTIDGYNITVFYDDKCGLISPNGDQLIPFKYNHIRMGHDTTYFAITLKEDEKRYKRYWPKVKSVVVYNKHFQDISQIKNYDMIETIGRNQFKVQKDYKWGIVDINNQIIIPIAHNSIASKYGNYIVYNDSTSGIYSSTGEILFPLEYQLIQFTGNVLYASKKGLIGLYSLDYREIVASQFISQKWDAGKNILTDAEGRKGFVKHQKDTTYYQSPEGEIIFFY